MKKLFVLTFSLIFLLLSFNKILADSSLNFVKGNVNESGIISQGVTYESFSAKTYTDYGTEGDQNISVVKASSDSNVKIMTWSILDQSTIRGGNVIEIAENFEALNPGFEVLAAINGDYFNMTTHTPINALVQNGNTIKFSNFYLERYFSVGFTNDDNLYITNKQNELEDFFSLTIYDNQGIIIEEIPLLGLNKVPSEGETSLYCKNLNDVYINDAFIMEADIENIINIDSLYVKAVLSGETNYVGVDNSKVVIVTKNDEVASLLEDGYSIKVQKYISGVYEGIDNIIGVGSEPLEAGLIKDFEDINDQSVSFAEARHPRSSFGFSDDGDFYMVTFDGRQVNMDGVNLREMSKAMSEIGAYNAFNLDGGGSTQIAIKDGDDFKMLNSPSDVPYRKVSDAILIVKPDIYVTGSISEIVDNNFDFEYGISADGLVINNTEIYLNNQLINSDDNPINITITEDSGLGIYYVKVIVNYEKNGNDYTNCFFQKRIYIKPKDEPNTKVKSPPSNFQVTISKSEDINGFIVNAVFDDPSESFVKMYLVYDDKKELFTKGVNGYNCEIKNAIIDKNYSLKIEYYYLDDKFNLVNQQTSDTYYFTYTNSDQQDGLEPENNNAMLISIIVGSSLAIITVATIIVIKIKPKILH